MKTIPVSGCTPVPLAAYLKGLGIMRILSQQCPEANVKGFWRGNTFVLNSDFDGEAIIEFFLTRYSPSPIVAPWNGGSGLTRRTTRLRSKRLSLHHHLHSLISGNDYGSPSSIDITGAERKAEKEAKEALLLRCRNTFFRIRTRMARQRLRPYR